MNSLPLSSPSLPPPFPLPAGSTLAPLWIAAGSLPGTSWFLLHYLWFHCRLLSRSLRARFRLPSSSLSGPLPLSASQLLAPRRLAAVSFPAIFGFAAGSTPAPFEHATGSLSDPYWLPLRYLRAFFWLLSCSIRACCRPLPCTLRDRCQLPTCRLQAPPPLRSGSLSALLQISAACSRTIIALIPRSLPGPLPPSERSLLVRFPQPLGSLWPLLRPHRSSLPAQLQLATASSPDTFEITVGSLCIRCPFVIGPLPAHYMRPWRFALSPFLPLPALSRCCNFCDAIWQKSSPQLLRMGQEESRANYSVLKI